MHTKFATSVILATATIALTAGVAQAASVAAKDKTFQQPATMTLLAREASEPARGRDNERPGDRQRGRNMIEMGDQVAREANEPPRGQDNNRNRRNRGQG